MLASLPVYPRQVIREATEADYPAAYELSSIAFPEFVSTFAGYLHRQTSVPAEARARRWVAEEDGRVVGSSGALYRYEESGGSANVGAVVHPEWRRRGVGTALLRHALEHVADATRVFAFAAEEGRPFAEHHGFELSQVMRVSAVDPRTVDTSELGAAEVRSAAELGPEAAFAVYSVAALDVPAEERPDRIAYEQWLRDSWENPDFDWSASFVALDAGRPAAISVTALDVTSRRGANAFTGTLPEHRGRGLARLTKLAVLRRLANLGVERVYTDNDERNAPMLAVNGRLGYRAHAAHYVYARGSGNGLRASADST